MFATSCEKNLEIDSTEISQYKEYEQSLRTEHDKRFFCKKSVDFVISFFREFHFLGHLYYRRFFVSYAQHIHKPTWNEKNTALFVLIHGLRSHPAAWHDQLQFLTKKHRIEIFTPLVKDAGFCCLKQAVEPIFKTIEDYAKKHPQNPICLLGHSNGSRIAARLECKLRKKFPQTPVMVSTIAGVLLGSSRMNLIRKIPFSWVFYPVDSQRELTYVSPVAHKLVQKMNNSSSSNSLLSAFAFYATADDLSVPELSSSIPPIDNSCVKEKVILHGHSHDSIVSAVAEKQITTCLNWMASVTSKKIAARTL